VNRGLIVYSGDKYYSLQDLLVFYYQ